MKWSVALALWLAATLVDGGALRCVPGEDAACGEETEKVPKKPDELPHGLECATGSQWSSRCSQCVCADGRPSCTETACDQHQSGPDLRCAPDSTWLNDCNTCWCTSDGRAMCTRVGCVVEMVPDSVKKLPFSKPVLEAGVKNGSQDSDKEIEVTKMYTKSQSKVTHLEDTEHPDVEIEKRSPDSEPLDHSFEELDYNFYEPGKDLNHIYTVQDQNNLLEEVEKQEKHIMLKRSVCKPGEVFQAECNACKCAPDGQSYTCSHNECMEGEKNKEVEVFMESEGTDHIERHTVCAARGTFYIGCNTCHCNALGTDYSCTNKPCPLPEDVELFHELKTEKASSNKSTKQVCVANRMFIKDCNTCWCNEDGTSFFCTRKVCVPELPDDSSDDKPEKLRVIMKECRPDEVFELDCNMCRCNPDGKSYSCTRRACVDADHPVIEPVVHDVKNEQCMRKTRAAQEARKVCEPGTDFRMDCNTCLCDDLGYNFSCTRNDCNNVNKNGDPPRVKRETSENVTMACVAGSVFDRDCNVCRCASDGQRALCTHKPCAAPQPEPDTTPAPDTDPNFRCSPGEQIKRACNDCQCSADGRSVFCTVRFCDQDITPPPSV